MKASKLKKKNDKLKKEIKKLKKRNNELEKLLSESTSEKVETVAIDLSKEEAEK
jgi:cell division protein FtsB